MTKMLAHRHHLSVLLAVVAIPVAGVCLLLIALHSFSVQGNGTPLLSGGQLAVAGSVLLLAFAAVVAGIHSCHRLLQENT